MKKSGKAELEYVAAVIRKRFREIMPISVKNKIRSS